MGSSASGRYQFIEGTFKGLWKEVYGGDADAAWAAKRFDPAVQERLMDRLIVKNSAVLRDNGQPVDNGNLYIMHVLGAGDGPKLLNADPNEKASKYLSPKIISQNPTYFGGGKTVGEALAVIRSKVGGGAPVTPPRADKTAIYENIDKIATRDGWSYERTERAKQAADREVQRADSLAAREESLADREASEIVLGLGDKFTDVSKIPAAIRDRMDPRDLAKYQNVAERNSAPKDVVANGPVALGLNLQAINDPEGFKNASLGQYAGQVSRAELEALAVKQATMRKEKPGAFNPRSGIQSAITWGKKYGGVDVKDEDFVKVYDIMEAELRQRHKATNKAPTDAEYEAAFRSATREVKTVKKGVLWDSEGAIPRYKLEADNIPAKDRVKVESRFKSVYGRAPNEEELANAYRLGKGQYW